MSKEMDVLQKNHSITLLITLLKADRMFYSELKNKSGVASISTINSRLNDLKQVDFIKDETEEKTANGKYVGVKRYIWLTSKGKRVAEKLIEIDELLKEK